MGLRQPGLHNKALFSQLKEEGKGRGSKEGKEERKIDYKNGKNEKKPYP